MRILRKKCRNYSRLYIKNITRWFPRIPKIMFTYYNAIMFYKRK